MRGPARIGGMNTVWGFLWPCGSDLIPRHQPEYNSSTPAHFYPRITIKRCLTRLLAGGLLFLAASAVHATAPVGATPGSFAIGPSGAATYSIPIFAPPGTNGMAPKLSLNYNSQGGNGLLGMGWSIGGLSLIHRCGATIAIDGFKGGVNYDTNDRFCLDGDRLISIGGGEYRTQHESWQKIVAVGGTASDPSYFIVTTKDGTIHYYGNTTDSRIEVQGKSIARLWTLKKVQDLNGNYITITYQEDNAIGDFRPASIAYTGNGVNVPYNFVYFDYPTASRSDVIQAYEAGSLISATKLLTGIRSCTNSTCTPNNGLVRQYNLWYDPDGAVGRMRLKNIQECGSDGVCMPATTFSWQDGGSNFTTSLWGGHGRSDFGPYMVDVNGDGRTDYVTISNSGVHYISLSNGNGYVNQTWVGHPVSDTGFYFADLNGDGKKDCITISQSGVHYVSISTGSGYINQTWSGHRVYATVHFADINGDGRDDFISVTPAFGQHYVSLSNGAGYTNQIWTGSGVSGTGGHFADLNGDGKADYITVSTNGIHYVSLSTGSGYINETWYGHAVSDSGVQFHDMNGDGKSDFVTASTSGQHFISFSTGRGYTNQTWQGYPYVQTSSLVLTPMSYFGDVNGDGKTDFVTAGTTAGKLNVSLSTGSGYVNQQWSIDTLPTAPSLWWLFLEDMNGDGKKDYVIIRSISGGLEHRINIANGPFSDLLSSITNGFGAALSFTYKSLTDSTVYTKDNNAAYPYKDIQEPTYVVSQSTQSNGIGGTNTTTYQYGGLKTHHTAATGLGFRWMKVTDPAGLIHVTYFNQTLNGTEGTVASSETWAGNVRVKYAGNTWTPVSLGGGRTLARLASTVEQTRELDNSIVSTINTSYSSYDSYGNPGTVIVDFNDGWSKTTNNTYNNDTLNWQLGQLLQSQVTAYAPGQTALTRTSSFTYDALGRLATEVIEPNSATLRLTTTYGYHPTFGTRTTKTLSGPGITTRTVETLTYDARGQFVTTRKNALNHLESYTYDVRTGAVTTVTDANNIKTTYTYNDGFGRKTGESRPGSPTTTIYYTCRNNTVPASGVPCPAPAGIRMRTVRTASGQTYVDSDMLGRPVTTITQGFNAAWIYQTTQYDSLGRVFRVSHPYFSGETKHYTTNTYYSDPLGRLWKVTEAGTGNRTTTMAYNGLSTTVTTPPTTASPSGQTKTTVKNSQGLVASVTDNAGTISYTYDPFGNLKTVSAVGVVTSMDYDIRGRKTFMNDPDMGIWTYGYNTLGELIWQKDAKLQTINMTYDLLGRMKTRVLPNGEGTSTWNYDTATYGKGKLQSVSNPSATETYVYDNLSRVSSQTTSISGITYTTSYTYDAYSRPLTLTYPVTGFKLYHVYDTVGHLKEVRKDTATGFLYWQASTFDAHSRLTKETLGNGLISQRAYNHETGDLDTIKTGTSTNLTSVQNSSFIFDALDNLTARSWWDGTAQRSETFGYDNLNRLASVSGPAPKTYTYYPNGNIQFKTGVGTYNYGTRPHAVASTVLGTTTTSYAYDANGNMTTRAGRTIGYFSFNKSKTIAGASGTTTLTYDANFKRVTKAAPGGTTTYIGKLYEKFVSGATTTQKHYLYAGSNLVGAYSSLSNNTVNTRYFHTDHLGSVEAITNETGGIVQRLSYDAFGKRRNVNGTDATTITAQTTRGYTRHEHDDEVGLINMNAREYDPLLGRFISPDTIIPGIRNSQAYNRYSYTLNNPLSRTDPTGNFGIKLGNTKDVVRLGVAAWLGWYSWHYVAWGTGSTVAASAASGAAFGGISTGTFKGAVYGGIGGAAFGYVGSFNLPYGQNIAAHAITGGTLSDWAGGDFRSGAIGAGFGAFASPAVELIPGNGGGAVMARVIFAGTIGGTAAHLAGGDFGNGFWTAAFGRLFNHEHDILSHRERIVEEWAPIKRDLVPIDVETTGLEDWRQFLADVIGLAKPTFSASGVTLVYGDMELQQLYRNTYVDYYEGGKLFDSLRTDSVGLNQYQEMHFNPSLDVRVHTWDIMGSASGAVNSRWGAYGVYPDWRGRLRQ